MRLLVKKPQLFSSVLRRSFSFYFLEDLGHILNVRVAKQLCYVRYGIVGCDQHRRHLGYLLICTVCHGSLIVFLFKGSLDVRFADIKVIADVVEGDLLVDMSINVILDHLGDEVGVCLVLVGRWKELLENFQHPHG